MRINQLEAGPIRLDSEGADAAVGSLPPEVGQEEVPFVPLGQAGAGVIHQPRGTIRHVQDRRNGAGRLHSCRGCVLAVGMPDVLAVPRPAIVGVLVVHPPAGVATLDDIHPTGLVAAIGVVVAREQIAEVVERQLLRIAEAEREHLQIAPIQVAPKHCPSVWPMQEFALLVHHMVAAIADAEVDPPVRPQLQPVHVVPAKGDPHPEPVGQGLLGVGLPIAVRISQLPQLRDARIEHVAVVNQDTRPGAVGDVVESIGEDGRRVGHAIAVRVLDQPQPVLLLGVVVGLIPEVLAEHRHPLVDRLQREIIQQPVHMPPVVLDPLLLAEGLADVDLPGIVDAEHDRVGQQRLGGEELRLDALGHLEAADGELAFLRCRSNRWGVLLRRRGCTAQSEPHPGHHHASTQSRIHHEPFPEKRPSQRLHCRRFGRGRATNAGAGKDGETDSRRRSVGFSPRVFEEYAPAWAKAHATIPDIGFPSIPSDGIYISVIPVTGGAPC